jgi:hypothetical protein
MLRRRKVDFTPRSRLLATAARRLAPVTVAACAHAAAARAQSLPATHEPWLEPVTGGDGERYLRALQVAGRAPWHQWSLRPFADGELAALRPTGDHPWSARAAGDARRPPSGVIVVTPEARSWFNSTAPFSMNDGAVWTGKGATVAASGGFALRRGVLSVRVQPVAFLSQNASFALMPTVIPSRSPFADAIEPMEVDAPQRFGDGVYGRVDPGQTTVRVDVLGLALGASTANETWGPAQLDPLLLGANAAGIPRVFVGTSRPLSWGLGTVHLRVEAGSLGQSNVATTHPDSARRLMAGAVGVVTLRGLPGLELGAARFYHRPWSARAFATALKIPFEAVFKSELAGKDSATADNQLASVFARWAVPAAGVEVYGEFGRNDHSQDLRDLLQEPDHNSAYTLGVSRAWGDARRLVAVRVETMNSRITHLARVRGQARWNQHGQLRQGHTQYGELLGSPSGLGGSAATAAVDVYRPDGRWSFEGARRVRQQPLGESVGERQIDVYNVLRAERLRFTPRGAVSVGAAAIHELNRDFRRDAFNLRLELGWRAR